MQISPYEVSRLLNQEARRSRSQTPEEPVRTVTALARVYDVDMEEVRDARMAMALQPEDIIRERRLMAVAQRVQKGDYNIDGEMIVEMAERRAIADCAGG